MTIYLIINFINDDLSDDTDREPCTIVWYFWFFKNFS